MGLLKRARPTTEAIEARIRDAITGLRPLLGVEATGIELVNFDADTGVAVLRIEGDCPDCEMSVAALLKGIEAHLKLRVPEIREIKPVSTVERDG
ncbi:MAG: NifU family protein [Burkholderiales bacterium]|nr:NifU family protein [Opitutaceae bacterium]